MESGLGRLHSGWFSPASFSKCERAIWDQRSHLRGYFTVPMASTSAVYSLQSDVNRLTGRRGMILSSNK